jgi:hypothetical protein
MNIKVLAALAAAAVMAASLSACGKEIGEKEKNSSKAETSAAEKDSESTAEEDSTAETTTAEPESKPDEKQEEEKDIKYIGEKDAKKADYSVELTNGTENQIIGFAINYGDGEYSENLIPSGEDFEIDEVRQLNWSHTVSGDVMTLGDFNVEITLEDGKRFELHGFPLTDMLSGEIRLMDEYAFLVYTNKIGDMKDTMKKESEIAEKEREEEEAKTSTTTTPAPEPEPVIEEEDTTTTTTAPESQPELSSEAEQQNGDQQQDNGIIY